MSVGYGVKRKLLPLVGVFEPPGASEGTGQNFSRLEVLSKNDRGGGGENDSVRIAADGDGDKGGCRRFESVPVVVGENSGGKRRGRSDRGPTGQGLDGGGVCDGEGGDVVGIQSAGQEAKPFA